MLEFVEGVEFGVDDFVFIGFVEYCGFCVIFEEDDCFVVDWV